MNEKIPDNYLYGYRRCVMPYQEITPEHTGYPNCFTCRHAIAHVTWWCGRKEGCKWEPAFKYHKAKFLDKLFGRDKDIGPSRNFDVNNTWIPLPDCCNKKDI